MSNEKEIKKLRERVEDLEWRHLPTHHPEIEINSKTIPSKKKSEIWKETAERKKGEWHGTAYNERFGTMAGVPRWTVLQNSKLSGS